MSTRLRISGLLGVLLIGVSLTVQGRAQEFRLHSVFQVLVIDKTTGHAVSAGTGFFIKADGTALTSSHIVYPVKARHLIYEALALLNREFYGVEIVCASDLPYDPTTTGVHGAGRDVAEIRLVAPREPELTYDRIRVPGHYGRLPTFPPIPLGDDPVVGDSVRILGFGDLTSPMPYEWSATGTVSGTGKAPDGTAVFNVTFTRKTEPGHSGSPVLNTKDQAVGIHTWHLALDPTTGLEISSSALRPACP